MSDVAKPASFGNVIAVRGTPPGAARSTVADELAPSHGANGAVGSATADYAASAGTAVESSDNVALIDLPANARAMIVAVHQRGPDDTISQRLQELGFVPGEQVRVVARGPFGGDPIAVSVGTSRFALRRLEAERIRVRPEPLSNSSR